MSKTFTKLFSSITESTIWREDDHTRLVWITMLAMSDRRGRVWASVPGLADRARVPIESCRRALERLLSPDPDSRTREHDGRRIEAVDGGWRLLNHEKYRLVRDAESERERKRVWAAKRRAEAKSVEHKVDACRLHEPMRSEEVDGTRLQACRRVDEEVDEDRLLDPLRSEEVDAFGLQKRLLVDAKVDGTRLRRREVDAGRRNADADADAYAERQRISSLRSEITHTQNASAHAGLGASACERAGALEAPEGSGDQNRGQASFKRHTGEAPRPQVVQATKATPGHDGGAAIDPSDPMTRDVLAELRRHPSLVDVATARLAERLAGNAQLAGHRPADVLKAIADAARDAGAQADVGHPLHAPTLAKLVGRYCANAGQFQGNASGTYKRRPEDIRQGKWAPTEADRAEYEASQARRPRLTPEELAAELAELEADEARRAS